MPGAHVMKLNYTSLQHAVLPVEGARAAHAAARPVGVFQLHGQLAPVAWALAQARRGRGAQVGYVQTAGGALPGAMSRHRPPAARSAACSPATRRPAPRTAARQEAITTAGALHDGLAEEGWDVALVGPGPGDPRLRLGARPRRDRRARLGARGARARLPDGARRAHVVRRPARAPPRPLAPHAHRARAAARAGDARRAAGRALFAEMDGIGGRSTPRARPGTRSSRRRSTSTAIARAACRRARWAARSTRTACSSPRRSPPAARWRTRRGRRDRAMSDASSRSAARRSGAAASARCASSATATPTARRSTREIVAHPGAVAIVAHDDEHVWLVRQPREIVGERALLEIPAGKLDETARTRSRPRERELAEEIGKAAGALGAPEGHLHEPRLHRRAHRHLPRDRPARRRAPARRGGRADRDRRLAAAPPRRRDRRVQRREVARRPAAAAGAAARLTRLAPTGRRWARTRGGHRRAACALRDAARRPARSAPRARRAARRDDGSRRVRSSLRP